MIQESYVSFEQAKALKELGFSTFCDCFYSDKHTLNGYYSDERDGKVLYDAPTLSLVQKWLREEKGLIIEVLYNVNNKDWYYWLYVNNQSYNEETNFNTYEQALSSGIDKCIELLKENERKGSTESN